MSALTDWVNETKAQRLGAAEEASVVMPCGNSVFFKNIHKHALGLPGQGITACVACLRAVAKKKGFAPA